MMVMSEYIKNKIYKLMKIKYLIIIILIFKINNKKFINIK